MKTKSQEGKLNYLSYSKVTKLLGERWVDLGLKKYAFTYTKKVLPSGLRVIAKKMSSPLVAINFWAPVGVKDEKPEKNGLSHFFEHMVFKGTTNYPASLLSRRVQALGGVMNAGTSLDTTDFYLVVPQEYWREALELEVDLLFHPLFDPQEIEKEKMVVIQEIHLDEDDPEERLTHLLYERVFSGTPYGKPILGVEDTVKTFTREDLLEHQKHFYHPANLTLVVVGDVIEEEVFAEAERLVGEFHDVENFVFSPFPTLLSPNQQMVSCSMDVHRYYGAIGFLTEGIREDDFYLLRLLSLILGDGIGSRLNIALREEKKLVDTIHAAYSYYQKAGIFAIFYTFSQGEKEKIEEEIQKEVRNLISNPPEEEELMRGKNLLRSSLFSVLETTSGAAELLGRFDVTDNIDRVVRHFFNLGSFKSEDIVEMVRKYLDFERATFIFIEPGA